MIEALREATRAHRTQASSCSLLGGWLALLHVPAHFLRPTKRGTQTLLHSFKKPCKRSACVARAQRRSAYLRSLLAHGALILSDARVLLRFCVSECGESTMEVSGKVIESQAVRTTHSHWGC